MRLLHSKTRQLREFLGDETIPPYAILSHTWGRGEEEVTYQDMLNSKGEQKAGYSKITNCCDRAVRDELEWAWVDTCCIDKSSSAELSEAINSMFQWYKNAYVCYVYLADVSSNAKAEITSGRFAESRWFDRGWTLQELVAPANVVFFSKDWTTIGTKEKMSKLLSAITDVNVEILEGGILEHVSVARRMSWAARRETSRIEDIAYSLLGIFDVNMPLLYGEGTKAFLRLQEEILKDSNDPSVFVWGAPSTIPTMEKAVQVQYSVQNIQKLTSSLGPQPDTRQYYVRRGLLADSPTDFARSHNIVVFRPWPGNEGRPPLIYNKCVHIEAPVLTDERTGLLFAILGCGIDSPDIKFQHYVAIALHRCWDAAYFRRSELVLIPADHCKLSDMDSIRNLMRTIPVKQRGWILIPNL